MKWVGRFARRGWVLEANMQFEREREKEREKERVDVDWSWG